MLHDEFIYWEYESGTKTDRAEFQKLLDVVESADEIDPMTKGMLMMWGVFSEMERDIISQKVKSGMENARAKGHTISYEIYADIRKNIISQIAI